MWSRAWRRLVEACRRGRARSPRCLLRVTMRTRSSRRACAANAAAAHCAAHWRAFDAAIENEDALQGLDDMCAGSALEALVIHCQLRFLLEDRPGDRDAVAAAVRRAGVPPLPSRDILEAGRFSRRRACSWACSGRRPRWRRRPLPSRRPLLLRSRAASRACGQRVVMPRVLLPRVDGVSEGAPWRHWPIPAIDGLREPAAAKPKAPKRHT